MEATAKYLSVGRKDCRERLQDSICISASAFQRRGLHFRETGTSALVDTGIASSAGQRGHRTCSPARQRVGLLQSVFSGAQERWGVASDFRSSWVEPLPQNLQVKNVGNQDDCVSDPIGGLVRDNRSQGRIFSRRNLATTQEVPEVRFRGRSLPVSGSSVRPSFVTPHVHEMHGCSTGSSATPGHPHFKLHRRLADSGSV